MKTSAGPNEPCPCGSGKKYKKCCGSPAALEAQQRNRNLLIGVIAVVAVAGIVFAAQRIANRPAAEEAVTPRRVWSEEHGHWHDVDGGELPPGEAAAPPNPPSGTPAPYYTPPPGAPPPGKVWSPEHGHWHDA